MKLAELITIQKDLKNSKHHDYILVGELEKVDAKLISSLKEIESSIDRIKISEGNYFFGNKYSDLLKKKIELKIRLSDFPNYYESFSDFIESQKYLLENDEFYIYEYNYYSEDEENHHKNIEAYLNSLILIDLLTKVASHKSQLGNDLKLYFHQTHKSLILPISYNEMDLENSRIADITQIREDFEMLKHHEDRKLIFINELVNFFESREKKYSALLTDWDEFRSNYLKSYSLYLEGFSFDKIKTASVSHFQDLTDKIYDTIRKVSNYLFGIPIAFLFLLSRLDFTGNSLSKNTGLLIVGYLFLIIIWKVFFANIKESLDSIKDEISRFQESIKSVTNLDEIKTNLDSVKKEKLESQYDKLKLMKSITALIVALLTLVFVYISLDRIKTLVFHYLN